MARSSEIDAELMDFLYGELSEDDADRFRERLAKDPELSAEVEAFQRTREAFKALPVEEPPPAVSAQLLHEAAKRAPARKRALTTEERPGLWAAVVEFFQPLVRHPAAASFAALLLVGGVAGALYLRGVDSSQEHVRSEAPPPTASAPAAADRGLDLDGKDVAEGDGDGNFARLDGLNLETQPSAGYVDAPGTKSDDNADLRARLAEPEQEKALRESATESQSWSMNKKSGEGRKVYAQPPSEPLANAVSGADPLIVPEETAKPDPKPADKLGLTRDARDESKAEREQLEEKSVARQSPLRKSKETAPAKSPAPQGKLFDDDADDFGDAESIALEPQAAPPPPSAGSTSSVRSAGGGGSAGGYRVYKNRKDDGWARSAQGKLNQLLDRKITKKNRDKLCREAAKRANDILDRNPEYYYEEVESSKWLKPCSGFVAEETTRRVRKRAGGDPGRANAAKKRSKKAGGSSSKAKAAPAEADEAAVESE